MEKPDISIIIPVKNEAKNIPTLTRRIHEALKGKGITFEMIFVNDRSTDDSVAKIGELSKSYPITLHHKRGKPGKAYCILEGARFAQSKTIVMIDADLQYPPEAIPEMVARAKTHDVVVANRKHYKSTPFRRFASRANTFVFGRLLHGLRHDVQSGLKLFPKDILDHLDPSTVGAWSLDIPLLYTAAELGYRIGSFDITFEKRTNGESKIRFLQTALGIARGAFALKLRRRRIYHLAPENPDSMLGAGVAHRRRRFITHTTLPHHQSALVTLKPWQKLSILFLGAFLAAGLLVDPFQTAIIFVAILSTIYFVDVLFNLYLVVKSLHFPPEIKVSPEEIASIDERTLPIYSILCPLYSEAHVLPQFVSAIGKLDWPKQKLDVLLLLEEDDRETIEAARRLDLPGYIRPIIVPHSQPKTKPKACNYGLGLSRGQYVVIYDAEDVPDPGQLKIAYLAFSKVPKDVACLQAKLNFYNPHHNLLTKLFTAEYSLWFDVVLTGLQTIGTAIPLGGTSNHFRRDTLIKLHGWDPFNVTEDCDLGARLFKHGYQTSIIDSTTLEEANSDARNWLRQRSRWIKGYIQTYFVHMRSPVQFILRHGLHAFFFQLVVGGKIAFMLINPFLWLATISYFTLYALVGPTIEAIYPTIVFYMAAISLVFGNFLFLYYYMIGVAKREHWAVMKYIFLVPIYWLGVSISAVVAITQLIIKPHYWEKTHHGFHIRKEQARLARVQALEEAEVDRKMRFRRLRELASSGVATGGALIAGSLIGNVFNFLYNAYLGRTLNPEEFGVIGLIGSFIYITHLPLGALSKTVTHRSAYLLGKYEAPVKEFWVNTRRHALKTSLIASGIWLLSIPLLAQFFHADSWVPFILFTPVWMVGLAAAVDSGFLSGNLKFVVIAILVVVEAVSKFVLTVALVSLGYTQLVYAAIPLSMILSFLIGWWAAKRLASPPVTHDIHIALHFPKRFFAASVVTRLSVIAFLSLDVLLVKHYLPPKEAGYYALLSLVGKMTFFVGTLFSQFINPMVSRDEGAGRRSRRVFYKLLFATVLASATGFVAVGVLGEITVPILFGPQAQFITVLLVPYTLAMACFTVGSAIVTYHQIRKQYAFSIISFLLAVVQVVSIILFHQDIRAVTMVMLATGVAYVAIMSVLHVVYGALVTVAHNIYDFFELFARLPKKPTVVPATLRILICNWRDTKHVWSGGAEVYIHELARRWVADGHKVTVFCGNDEKHPRNEVVDGVQVVRRGGFYTVYLWAFLYYILRFRGLFDVVIDSQNGIPFFTPLYVRVPKFLLIPHIHQDVFRNHLKFPLSLVAMFLEAKIVPVVYRGQHIITISDSSKKEIGAIMGNSNTIEIIHPGVDNGHFRRSEKTAHPTFLYLGRLKSYKNIDVAIQAFSRVVRNHPKATLSIAGEGESIAELRKLTLSLGIASSVQFLGRVSENEKATLMATSWVMLQPSSVEGFGITVIEANACGTPVIASNVNGLRDSVVYGKTGILVAARNVDAFADAMDSLIRLPTYRKALSREALVWSKTFSWEASAQNFQKIVTDTVSLSRTRPFVGIPILLRFAARQGEKAD